MELANANAVILLIRCKRPIVYNYEVLFLKMLTAIKIFISILDDAIPRHT